VTMPKDQSADQCLARRDRYAGAAAASAISRSPVAAGSSGMDTVTSVPGDVARTSNWPSAANTFVRVEAIPMWPPSRLCATFA
jgi:hypothetical protein